MNKYAIWDWCLKEQSFPKQLMLLNVMHFEKYFTLPPCLTFSLSLPPPPPLCLQFHSHQLFHILVVAGAFVHFHGVSNLQEFRYTVGAGCAEDGAL